MAPVYQVLMRRGTLRQGGARYADPRRHSSAAGDLRRGLIGKADRRLRPRLMVRRT